MAQVFSQTALQGDTWDMQGAVIRFGSTKSVNAMDSDYTADNYIVAIGVQLGFSQGVTKRYPINIRRVIYLLGSPDGNISINCLFGPNQSMANFVQLFSSRLPDGADGKESATITIKPFGTVTSHGTSQATTLNQGTWTILNPILTSVGLSISEAGAANAIQAVGQVSLTFNNLDIS